MNRGANLFRQSGVGRWEVKEISQVVEETLRRVDEFVEVDMEDGGSRVG